LFGQQARKRFSLSTTLRTLSSQSTTWKWHSVANFGVVSTGSRAEALLFFCGLKSEITNGIIKIISQQNYKWNVKS